LHLVAKDGGNDRSVLVDGDSLARVRPCQRRPNVIAFDVVDLDGTVVAHGGRHPDTFRKLRLRTAEGMPLLDLWQGWWRPRRLMIWLPDGTSLGVRAAHRFRWFTVSDQQRHVVATFTDTARSWSEENCPYQVTLREPVLTTVQAIGLGEFFRRRARASRQFSG
jgi:hypothetical protein